MNHTACTKAAKEAAKLADRAALIYSDAERHNVGNSTMIKNYTKDQLKKEGADKLVAAMAAAMAEVFWA